MEMVVCKSVPDSAHSGDEYQFSATILIHEGALENKAMYQTVYHINMEHTGPPQQRVLSQRLSFS